MRHDAKALFARLDQGMEARLTLLLAADGSPALLRRWLTERSWPRAVAELTVDHNSPVHFVAHLAAALSALTPSIQPAKLALGRNIIDATGQLLNVLLTVEADFAVVLENYDAITAPAVHAVVGFMTDYPPPQMHLYVVTQTEPPLPLARLRVRQQLVEIDLREPT